MMESQTQRVASCLDPLPCPLQARRC